MGMARSAAPSAWEFNQEAQILSHDHPLEFGGLGFSPMRQFRSGAQAVRSRAAAARHRDGAELAPDPRELPDASAPRTRRVAAARLPTPRHSLLRCLTSPTRLRRRLDDRHRIICKGTFEATNCHRPEAELAQALPSRSAPPGLAPAGAGFPFRPMIPDSSVRLRGRPRYHRRVLIPTHLPARRDWPSPFCRRFVLKIKDQDTLWRADFLLPNASNIPVKRPRRLHPA